MVQIKKSFLYKTAEMLIEQVEYIPLENNDGELLVGEEYSIFRKVSGNKARWLEIYDGDLLTSEDISSALYSHPVKREDLKFEEKDNVFYIKVFIFSKRPSDHITDDIKKTYSDRVSENNDLACIALNLEERDVLLSQGIVYPNHMVYEVIISCLNIIEKHYENIDIVKVLEKNDAKPKSEIIVEDDDRNIINTVCFRIAYIYLAFSMLIFIIKVWTDVTVIRLYDNNLLTIIANIIFLLTVGKMAEDNYGGRKLLVIMFFGGFFSTILFPVPAVYSFILPIAGALLYMRFRVADTLKRTKFIKGFLILYILLVTCYGLFRDSISGLIPIAGIILGFCTAGILGFEGEFEEYRIKNNMSTIFICCALLLSTVKIIFMFL